MLRTLFAGIRTFVLVPLFLVVTALFSAFIVAYGALRPAAPVHDTVLKVWSGLWLRIPPVRIEVVGIEKVDPHQRYIVVSNHLSMFDIPVLFRFLPLHGRFLAKQEVFKIPLVAQAMRTIGIIEINRERGRSARHAINNGVRIAAERGYSLLIFPEATRGTDGTLLDFKRGAFRIAIDTGLSVLPVVIEGTEQVSAPRSKVFYPGHVSLRILDPIETTGMTNKDDLKVLTESVETAMNAEYAEMRSVARQP